MRGEGKRQRGGRSCAYDALTRLSVEPAHGSIIPIVAALAEGRKILVSAVSGVVVEVRNVQHDLGPGDWVGLAVDGTAPLAAVAVTLDTDAEAYLLPVLGV